MKNKQIIIIGGGASINEGIEKGLWNKLKDKYTIGLNYSYNYFKSTFQCCVDRDFYDKQRDSLTSLPLIVSKKHRFSKGTLKNTILLTTHHKYNRALKEGVYKASLVGLFALSLGIYLLDEGEIYLLGYDFGELRKKDYRKFATSKKQLQELSYKDDKGQYLTHFYQGDIKHRGIGKVSYYNSKGRANQDLAPYKGEKKVKIYNVSKQSKIEVFPKISYDEFFKKLDNQTYNQNFLRQEIEKKLEKLPYATRS